MIAKAIVLLCLVALASVAHAFNAGDCIQATTTVNIRPVAGCSQGPVGQVSQGSVVSVTGSAAYGTCSGSSLEFAKISQGYVAAEYFTKVSCGGNNGGGGGSNSGSMGSGGLDLLKRSEGWRSCAYYDAVGVLTIGYGHVIVPGDGYNAQSCISQTEVNYFFLKLFVLNF